MVSYDIKIWLVLNNIIQLYTEKKHVWFSYDIGKIIRKKLISFKFNIYMILKAWTIVSVMSL